MESDWCLCVDGGLDCSSFLELAPSPLVSRRSFAFSIPRHQGPKQAIPFISKVKFSCSNPPTIYALRLLWVTYHHISDYFFVFQFLFRFWQDNLCFKANFRFSFSFCRCELELGIYLINQGISFFFNDLLCFFYWRHTKEVVILLLTKP